MISLSCKLSFEFSISRLLDLDRHQRCHDAVRLEIERAPSEGYWFLWRRIEDSNLLPTVDVMLFEFVAERGAGHSQALTRMDLIPAMVFHGFL